MKSREAGVGIIVRVNRFIEISSPDVNEERIMAINLKIHDFNVRIVNGYSPIETGESDNLKDLFYRNLKTACVKTHKHQKLIVVGDFNATTNVATCKSCYDRVKIGQDPECSDNGSRPKSFCRSHKLCISRTFFEHAMIHRQTWYRNDKITRKINDYVLVEKYVQKYITDCRAEPEYDFDSDYRLLKTILCTRKARRSQKLSPTNAQPDIKELHNPEIKIR